MTDTTPGRCEPADEWRPIPGYVGFYEINSHGAVRTIGAGKARVVGRILRGTMSAAGYMKVPLSAGNVAKAYRVHRLVAAAFLGPCPDGAFILHNDGDQKNNHVSNLRYGNAADNHRDARRHGTYRPVKGEDVGTAKLTAQAVAQMRRNRPPNAAAVARSYGVDPTTIRKAINGRSWRSV